MAENPVSGITRLPVANSTQFGIPPSNRVGNGLVLAPTIPFLFDGGWSVLTRASIPVVVTVPFASEAAPPSTGRTTGFGDIGLELLGHKMLRGKKRQFYDLGLGPFVGFPSASDDLLGTGRWRLGPEIALAISARHWVTVLIVRNEWSVGNGSNRADVNQLWLQSFLFCNLPKLFYLVYEPMITANWNAQPGAAGPSRSGSGPDGTPESQSARDSRCPRDTVASTTQCERTAEPRGSCSPLWSSGS